MLENGGPGAALLRRVFPWLQICTGDTRVGKCVNCEPAVSGTQKYPEMLEQVLLGVAGAQEPSWGPPECGE